MSDGKRTTDSVSQHQAEHEEDQGVIRVSLHAQAIAFQERHINCTQGVTSGGLYAVMKHANGCEFPDEHSGPRIPPDDKRSSNPEPDRGVLINRLAAMGMRLTSLRAELPAVEKQARKTPRKDMHDERAKVEAAKARVEPMRAEIAQLEADYSTLHSELIRLGAYPGSAPLFVDTLPIASRPSDAPAIGEWLTDYSQMWRCRCPDNPVAGPNSPDRNPADVPRCTLCNTERPGARRSNDAPVERKPATIANGERCHLLKTWPMPFEDVKAGRKPFEYRKHDRDYRVGDVLVLEKWEPNTERYQGAIERRRVTYLLPGGTFGLPVGYCVLGLGPEHEQRVDKASANDEAERLRAWIALMRSVTFGSDVPKTINIMTKHALDGRAASESAYGLLRVYRARVSQSGSEHRPGSPAPSTGSSPAGSVDASGVAPYSDYPLFEPGWKVVQPDGYIVAEGTRQFCEGAMFALKAYTTSDAYSVEQNDACTAKAEVK